MSSYCKFIIVALSVFMSLNVVAETRKDEIQTGYRVSTQSNIQNRDEKRIRIAVFTLEPKSYVESTLLPLLKQESACKNCEFVNYTPYNDIGVLDESYLHIKIDEAGTSCDLLYLAWNSKMDESKQKIVESLKAWISKGKTVVASAGLAKSNDITAPISKTVVGSVDKIIIIGEMGERERLLPQSYFGPELLTAVKPPKNSEGEYLGSALFVAKFSRVFSKNEHQDWYTLFKERKLKSRQLWPTVSEMLR